MMLPFTSIYPELETQRCQLKKPDVNDAQTLLELRSNSDVLKYLDREPLQSKLESLEFIKKMHESFRNSDGLSWHVWLKEPNKMIGTAGIWRINREHYRGEVGYLLHPDYWGKGILTEVLERVIRFGFDTLGLHSLEANVHPDNQASIRLLEKHGFVREGYFRENFYFRGKFSDTAVYSLVNS